MKYWLLALAAIAAPAAAQDRDLCTDRPGLGTPACTVEPGRVLVESSLADWTMSKGGGDRSDAILFGDTLVRVGVGKQLELQVGWTPLVYSRERTGTMVDRATRAGDVTLGTKLNFAGPDGNGFSAGMQVQATLPVGRAPIGAGDWGLSVILPVSYDLSDALQLQASPEIDAAVDEDGDGRHTAYGGTLGLNISISDPITVTLEAQAIRDRDPAGHSTQAFGGLSLTYQTSDDFQFDLGTNLGLNRASDDFELYAGISRRF